MKNLYLPISIIIGALIVGGVIFYTRTPNKEILPNQEELKAEIKTAFNITEKDHILGNPEARVTIVEFSDFQCSFCARFHLTVKQILDDYPNEVRWVYKHFPLDQIHSQARPAAEAAECVFEQKGNDGFWQFADSLFENQSRLGESLYKELAQTLGLDMGTFENCISSGKYKNLVEENSQEGQKAGVQGTPASFINGEFVSGAVPYEALKSVVEKALK